MEEDLFEIWNIGERPPLLFYLCFVLTSSSVPVSLFSLFMNHKPMNIYFGVLVWLELGLLICWQERVDDNLCWQNWNLYSLHLHHKRFVISKWTFLNVLLKLYVHICLQIQPFWMFYHIKRSLFQFQSTFMNEFLWIFPFKILWYFSF